MSLDQTFFVVSEGQSVEYQNSQGDCIADIHPGPIEVLLVNDTWQPAAATITLAGKRFPLTVHRDTAYYIKPFSCCTVPLQVEDADLANDPASPLVVTFYTTSEPKANWIYGNAMARYNAGRMITVKLGRPAGECEFVPVPDRVAHLSKELADALVYRMVEV